MIHLLLRHRPHASPLLQDAMIAYIEYRSTSKHGPWTERACGMLLRREKDVSDLQLAEAFRQSVRHGWQGVFPRRVQMEKPVVGLSMDPRMWEAWRP